MENILTQPQYIKTTFLLRRGLISEWEEKNPVLAYGEPGVGYEIEETEDETVEPTILSYVLKIGDGKKPWKDLGPVASDKEVQLKYENFEYEINNLVNQYIVLGPPQESGERLPAAGMIYSTYGLGDTPGAIDEYDVEDHLVVEGKSALAIGRNIKILDDPNAAKPDEQLSNYASAFGAHHNISGYGSFTAGVNNDVSSKAKYGVTAGNHLYNNGSRAVAFGEGTNRLTKILSEKNMTIADIANLNAEDFEALLRPERTSTAWGDYSFISGRDNIAYGKSSVAIGEWLFTGGEYATAFGYANRVLGNKSTAFGDQNVVKANTSLALGSQNTIDGRDDGNGYSTASGLLNKVKGKYSFTSGWNNQNNGDGTAVLGWANRIGSKSTGQGSVVTGKENIVDTGYAFAAGTKSYANHYGSSVLGMGLKSAGANSTVVGQFNQPKSSILFAVGNGSGTAADLTATDSDTFDETSNVKRSNALEVYKDGHAEIGAMGSTDNTIVTKKYADDNSAELKRYVDAQTTVETRFLINSNIITLENLDPSGTTINSEISYIASTNDVLQNGTFENETVPTEWAQILSTITFASPTDTSLAGYIDAIDATATQYVRYYKGKMNIEINRTYILEMKVCGKIGVSLVSSQGIGAGSGWTVFESPSEEWQTFRKQFTCVGRSNGTAENVGWTMGFGLPKGETSDGAFIDDVKIFPLCEVAFVEGEDTGNQVVNFADPDTGGLPVYQTTATSFTIYTHDDNSTLGTDLSISGSYTKSLKSALDNNKKINVVKCEGDIFPEDIVNILATYEKIDKISENSFKASLANIEEYMGVEGIKELVGVSINSNTLKYTTIFDEMVPPPFSEITYTLSGCVSPNDTITLTYAVYTSDTNYYYKTEVYQAWALSAEVVDNTLYYIHNETDTKIAKFVYQNTEWTFLEGPVELPQQKDYSIESIPSMNWDIQKQDDKILYGSAYLYMSNFEAYRTKNTAFYQVPLPSELYNCLKVTGTYNKGNHMTAMICYCRNDAGILNIQIYFPEELAEDAPVDWYGTFVVYS